MKIVFHCYGGTHASPVAAACYLGQLPAQRPKARDLLGLALFDRVPARDFGRLIPVGSDAAGNQVFVLGCGRHASVVRRALRGFTRLLPGDPEELLLVDVYRCINFLMRIGGFTSRTLGLVAWGRPLVAWGTLLAYPRLVALAESVRQQVGTRAEGGNGS